MSQPTDPTVTQRLQVALSGLVNRMKFLSKAGLQYEGKRDVYKVAGYPKSLTFDDFWAMYTRGDIAGRIVDMQAQTTWRTPPEITVDTEGDDDEGQPTSPFIKEFEATAKRLRLWSRLEQLDRLSGVGRYGVMLIGVVGEEELSTPLPAISRPEDILYLSVYHEKDAEVKAFVTDPRNKRFGLPELYQINLAGDLPNFGRTTTPVHHTRVIHAAEDLLTDRVFGQPRLERVYNRLMDLEKVTASTGEAYWQLATRILALKVDPEAEVANPEKTLEQLEEIVHDLRRVFMGQGMEPTWLQSEPPSPEETAKLLVALIAGARGIPMRMLIGSETGERASTEDQRTYLGTINERIERFAEPILRDWIDRMIEAGAFSSPPDREYNVVWPDLREMDEKEKAEANRARADAARLLTPVGGDPTDLIEVDENRDVWLLTDAMRKERAEERAKEEEEEAARDPKPITPPPPTIGQPPILEEDALPGDETEDA